jgi:uncharacterized membrane protein YeaQ/YmgE (transglycosylase-associated protein family)
MGTIAWIVLGAIVGIIAEKLTGQRLGLLLKPAPRVPGVARRLPA